MKGLNKEIYKRGYVYNHLKTLIKEIHSYNNVKNSYDDGDLDSKVFEILDDNIFKYVSSFTRFNSVGDTTKNDIFIMLSDKDKQYS